MVGLRSLLWGVLGAHLSMAASAQTDALEDLKHFSEFRTVDLRRLNAGGILGDVGPPMSFPQGASAQTCFVVPMAPKEAASRLQSWDPSLHASLKALEFHKVSQPCQASDFESLILKSDQRVFRWLLDKTRAATAGKSELNLTRAEARQLADCAKGSPDPHAIGGCWATVLQQRATAYQNGGLDGVAPYEATGETVSPAAQIRAMLREQKAVAGEFEPLLQASGVLGGERTASLSSFYYWGLYEAEYHATLILGVVYLVPVGDRYQLLDVQYYVSATYYTFVTLYEMWPIQVGEKPGALVWRGDFIAAPTLAFAKGIDRLAYSGIMLQELKKGIRIFQDDVKAHP